MYYIKNPAGEWLLPTFQWYHGRPTFTNVQDNAETWTELAADEVLLNTRMHPGAFKEHV